MRTHQRAADSRQRAARRSIERSVAPIVARPGRALAPEVRATMETGLGHEFGDVRIHTDARAHDSARGIRALAYTFGSHVVFARGQYRPQTRAGARLLAHELTHVLQQRAAPPAGDEAPARAGEHQADAIADRVVGDRPPQPGAPARVSPIPAQVMRDGGSGPTDEEILALIRTRSFAEVFTEFERHRYGMREAEALALVPDLLARMRTDDAIDHAGELAVWLLQRDQWPLALQALHALESAWWIRFVTLPSAGGGVPNIPAFALGAGPRGLITEAEREAAAGRHDRARELFSVAFTMLQMQLLAHSDRRFTALARMSQLDPRVSSGFTLFRIWSYMEEGTLIASMRQIIGFYTRQERDALAAGQVAQAQQLATLGQQLRAHLRENSLMTGDSDSTRAITLEATQADHPQRGPGFTIHGVDGQEEFVTPLPGTPRPDELGTHPAYSTTMENLFGDIAGQEDFITDLHRHQPIRAAFGNRPIDMQDRRTRLRVWRIMYAEFASQPLPGCSTALCSLLRLMERYLRHYTTHTEYNIRDFGQSYLTSEFPQDLVGRAVRDCGVYALTVAHEVFRTARGASPPLPVSFQLYHTLDHVMLAIMDTQTNEHYVVNNDQIIGPRTGDPTGTIATAYADLTGRPHLISVAGRTATLSTQLTDAAFRQQIWQRYQTGARLGLATEPPTDPSDTRTEAQRRTDTYQHYYDAVATFDRAGRVAHAILDQLNTELAGHTPAEQLALLTGRLDVVTRTGVEMIRVFVNYALNSTAVGLTTGPNVPMQRIALTTSGRTSGNHPLVRVATALLFAQQLGHPLTSDQTAVLTWIAAAPLPSFAQAIAAYNAAGRPPAF